MQRAFRPCRCRWNGRMTGCRSACISSPVMVPRKHSIRWPASSSRRVRGAAAGHLRGNEARTSMLIADAQVHIWAANTPERPWPARAEPHRAPLGKDELLAEMDKAGVDRVVIVPPSWEGDRNDLAIEAAQSHPDRFAVMGRLDPDLPGAREQIVSWKSQPGMLGMRFTFHTEIMRQPLLDGRFDWVWGEMEKAGIPAMVLFHHEYMHLADRIAERYPGLRLVLDHLGLKSGKTVTEASN